MKTSFKFLCFLPQFCSDCLLDCFQQGSLCFYDSSSVVIISTWKSQLRETRGDLKNTCQCRWNVSWIHQIYCNSPSGAQFQRGGSTLRVWPWTLSRLRVPPRGGKTLSSSFQNGRVWFSQLRAGSLRFKLVHRDCKKPTDTTSRCSNRQQKEVRVTLQHSILEILLRSYAECEKSSSAAKDKRVCLLRI